MLRAAQKLVQQQPIQQGMPTDSSKADPTAQLKQKHE
jgi:hypothetical protein